MRLLPSSFFERHTVEVAKELLGKVIVVDTPLVAVSHKLPSDPSAEAVRCTARIVEVEAYRQDDPASHSYKGRTPRTAVMFGPPGHAYVYHIHRYQNLNFVTEPEGTGGGVLIRAVEPLTGIEHMRMRRMHGRGDVDLTNGPGKLTQSLGLNLRHNGSSLQGPHIRVYDDGYRPASIHATRRIGISRAVEIEWRFIIPGHPFVSGKKSLNVQASSSITTMTSVTTSTTTKSRGKKIMMTIKREDDDDEEVETTSAEVMNTKKRMRIV